MKVLLTSGPTALERSTIDALIARSHDVRLLADRAHELVREWPAHVEPWQVSGPADPQLADATNGCGAVIHLAGLSPDAVDEPAAARVSVDDTLQLVHAAVQSGVSRFVLVLPLGGNGDAPSRAARRAAEASVREFPGDWLIIRTTHVYGPGDELVSRLLLMMRTLPAVPMLTGEHTFRPLWHEDLAAMLAASVDLDRALMRQVVEVAGPEPVTMQQIYDRIAALTDRRPVRIPVPEFVATHGSRLAEALGLARPLTAAAFSRPPTDDAVRDLQTDAAQRVFGVTPTPFETGLHELIDGQEEQLPAEGSGTLEVKRFRADIHGSRYDAATLLQQFRLRLAEIMPIEVGPEPASSQTVVTTGATLTMAIPGRGHVQVRVEKADDREVVFATLRGHLLAGFVRFATGQHGDAVRFEVTTCDAAGSPLDWLGLSLGGAQLQNINWTTVVQRVVELSGGRTDDIEVETRRVHGEEADQLDAWIHDVVQERRAAARRDAEMAEARSPR